MSPLPPVDGWPRRHAPFEKGNQYRVGTGNKIAQTHGAFTPSLVEPEAEKFRETILSDPESDYLRAPRFSKRLWSYCLSEARVMRIEAWVSTMSDEEAARSDKGQTSPLELLRKWKTTAANEANKLGLDPVSWARIKKDYATANRIDISTILTMSRAAAEADDRSGLDQAAQLMDTQWPGLSAPYGAAAESDPDGRDG